MNPLEEVQSKIIVIIAGLPLVVGNAAVNWVKDSFTQQGWRGAGFEAWKALKNEKRKGAAILIKTGRLRRSIRIVKLNASAVSIGSSEDYAEAHNNGFTGVVSVKGYKRNKYGKAKATDLQTKRSKSISFIANTQSVKPFTRNMNLPRRQFAPNDVDDSPIFRSDMEGIIKNQFSMFK